MGWRFRKLLKIGPVNLSLGKTGVGESIGVRGLRIGMGADGRRYVAVGIPGTGISYRKDFGRARESEQKEAAGEAPSAPPRE